MKLLHGATYILVIAGAVNWGLIGLLNYNLVNTLVGGWPMVEQVVYILVGLSAVYDVLMHPKICRLCGKGK
ncbi:MAG: DUF378 domain-containing protein [Candidatus Levybacteria bacterium]|nr:DUF378 domain-containing protein [Candidatus Levybacteria bacterium]